MFGMLTPRVRRAFRLAVRRADWTRADVDAEVRFHVEMRTEQLVAAGWSRADAEAEARRRFGSSWDNAVRALHRSGDAREERLAMRERLDALWYDIRYAARSLRHAPRFAAAAVLTLGLGLGATTLIFSLVDHVVLRPLPYGEPERLVVVREVVGDMRASYASLPANGRHFLEFRRACRSCSGMAALRRSAVTLSGEGDPQRLGAARVSAGLFEVLGVRPALGRTFREDEDRPGHAGVVMLSDGFWRRQFGGDPRAVGRTITINDEPVAIIGVLPPAGGLPPGDALGGMISLARQIDIYRPLAMSEREATTAGEYDYGVIARLAPGATPSRLEGELDGVVASLAPQDGTKPGADRVLVLPLQAQVVGSAREPMLLLLAAVGAVLLIVCVNLTNLSLARNVGRQRESAVRVALGAGWGRLARQALTESLAIAVAGGALGLLLAQLGLRSLLAFAPVTLPRLAEVRLDGRVFAAAACLTILIGIVIGVVPAARSAGVDPGEALKSGSRTLAGGRSAARWRSLFITAQVACSTVLLAAAGLFLSSFIRVLGVDRGFNDTDRVLALDVALPATGYGDAGRLAGFYERVVAEVAAVPGVESAAAASALPLEGETWVNGVARSEDVGSGAEPPPANYRFVTPGYLQTVGTPLRRGREFDAGDRGRRVAIVSERTARTLWPGEDPVGRSAYTGEKGLVEVVGVAADVHTSSLEREGSLVVYLPMWDNPQWQGSVIARTAGEPAAMTAAIRAAIRRVDPAVPVPRVRTMAQVVSAATAARHFQLTLLAVFAAMALVTASVGIYGVISQSLASRTGEIGVRMALGAQPGDVHRMVLREGLTPVAIGLAIGLLAAVVAGRAAAGLLFQVRPGDPATLAGVTALLGLVAVVACIVPARRATANGLAVMLRAD